MKTKLIFGLAFLAIGIGASQVFLHRGDAKANSEVPQSHITSAEPRRAVATPVSMIGDLVAEPEHQQAAASADSGSPASPGFDPSSFGTGTSCFGTGIQLAKASITRCSPDRKAQTRFSRRENRRKTECHSTIKPFDWPMWIETRRTESNKWTRPLFRFLDDGVLWRHCQHDCDHPISLPMPSRNTIPLTVTSTISLIIRRQESDEVNQRIE